MSQPPRASLVRRGYRLMLRLLPADMRARNGPEIAAMFDDAFRTARARGRARAAAVVLMATWDILHRAPYERWRRRGRRAHEESSMRSVVSDLRFGVRSFARQPGATALILLTLTLGIAANTAVFAIVDGLFLRPFPFPQPERLVYLNERAPAWNLEFTNINYPDFHGWRERTHAFEAMAVFTPMSVNLADGSRVERVDGLAVTYDFPKVLGIQPVLGRTFTRDEDRPDGPRLVVISYGLWRSRFGGARDVIGKVLRVDSRPFTIIGVLPPEGDFPGNTRFWIAVGEDPDSNGRSYSYDGIARLKSGVTLEQARADLLRAHAPIWAARDSARVVSPRIDDLRDRFVSEYRAMGKALGVGALLVLLIACANVAGTMLARAIGRRREIGIRLALGASSRRVSRQLITESFALACIAGIAGTLLGRAGLRLLVAASPDQVPPWVRLSFDARTATFAVGVIVTTALVFGLVPSFQLRRTDVAASLAFGSGTRTSAALPQRRLLDGLVVLEVALALVLLGVSGLLVRAYANLRSVNPGFRPDGLTTFRISLPRARYADGAAQQRFYARLVSALESAPGISGAGTVTCLPFGCHMGMFLRAEGAPPPRDDGSDPVVLTRFASPGYFRTMGIELLHGRFYRDGEGRPDGPHPVVVNEQLVRQLWPNVDDPTGRRMTWRSDAGDTSATMWMTVVGVVRDVRHYGLVRPMRPGFYRTTADIDSTDFYPSFGIAVRSTSDPARVAATARRIVRTLDPELPLIALQSGTAAVARSIAARRTIAFTFAAFGAVSLALALGGIYAVLSYIVGRRRHEIGIRMALGAQRGQVLQLVIRQGLRLVAIGAAIGLPVALLAGGTLSGLLVNVGARDPLTYAAAVGLLAVTAVLASLVPAYRAASVEPKSALNDG